VYNSATAGSGATAVTPGYYYWNGTAWERLTTLTNLSSSAWLLTGNAGTDPVTNFLGTTDNKDLVFRTFNTEKMRITNSGNVGIGTTTPNEQLEITGNLRLPVSTASVGLIKSGSNRFIHNFGINNFFAGVNAGNLTMTFVGGNTGVGVNALFSNTTGHNNTAYGWQALYSNTTGYINTASGVGALYSNTTGYLNTANGWQALYNNTTGNHNTANGTNALF
jgi:hypothetical protein